ncbi:MAG: helix-turn-helix transcriptional regulator [Duncaniella sp.]|nr:helix-turn-helix transcriptional regulator [Duncaniella sp.]
MPASLRVIIVSICLIAASVVRTEAAPDMHSMLEERLDRLADSPDDKTAIRDVANAYLFLGDYDNAGVYADKLMKIAAETGNRDFAGLEGTNILVQVLMVRGDWEQAYRALEYARVLAQGSGNHEALGLIHNGFILYYSTLVKDDYAAINHCFRGIEETRLAGDDYRRAILLTNLAEIYNDRGEADGLVYGLESYRLAQELGKEIPIFYSALILANAYIIKGMTEEAGEVLKVAEKYASSLGYDRSIELVLIQARYKYLEGNIPESLRLYEHAFNCDFHDPSRSIVMSAYLTYAKTLTSIGQPKKAIEIINEGLAYAKGFKLSAYVDGLMKEMARANLLIGDHRTALDYCLRYMDYTDSTYMVSRERAITEDRIKYEIDEQGRRIQENERQLRLSRLRMWILVGVVVVLVCFVAVVLEHYRRKKRLYRAIVMQNGEYLAREQLLLEQIEKAQAEKSSAEKTSAPKPTTSLSDEKADDILSRFTLLMTDEKLFKDPNLTVGAVADRLGSNRTYVSRAINESGKTFTQIVNDYRIREAIAMISDLDAAIPLKQICSDVGFSSISTFYSTFQNITGMTPARYRTQLKEMRTDTKKRTSED